MLPDNVIFLAAFVHLCATATYMCTTLRGETSPNRVSWFIWALAPLIATAAQLTGGVGLSTLIVFLSGLGPLVIFLCSFVNPKAYWRTSGFDYVCGGLAVCGLILWYSTRNQDLAIVFSILIDFLAGVPTLRKAYDHPESENGATYVLGFVASVIALLCVQQQTFTGYGFTGYLIMLYALLCFAIYKKRFSGWLQQLRHS
jgi:hypothetical protein